MKEEKITLERTVLFKFRVIFPGENLQNKAHLKDEDNMRRNCLVQTFSLDFPVHRRDSIAAGWPQTQQQLQSSMLSLMKQMKLKMFNLLSFISKSPQLSIDVFSTFNRCLLRRTSISSPTTLSKVQAIRWILSVLFVCLSVISFIFFQLQVGLCYLHCGRGYIQLYIYI